jgi:putative addiction module component (TIGR02574 family)
LVEGNDEQKVRSTKERKASVPALAKDGGRLQFPAMSLTSVYLAEEVLALPAAERETLARLLLESISPDRRSDEEIRKELNSRLARLQSGEDKGLTFDAVFGEPA